MKFKEIGINAQGEAAKLLAETLKESILWGDSTAQMDKAKNIAKTIRAAFEELFSNATDCHPDATGKADEGSGIKV